MLMPGRALTGQYRADRCGERCPRPAWAGCGAGRTGSLTVPKCGREKSNMVMRLPIAGRSFGTYAPGVAFGRLSSLKEVSGFRPQLASMNFRIDTWSV